MIIFMVKKGGRETDEWLDQGANIKENLIDLFLGTQLPEHP